MFIPLWLDLKLPANARTVLDSLHKFAMGEVMDTEQALEYLREITGVDIDIAAIKEDPLFPVVF